jgi:uncharacterized protein
VLLGILAAVLFLRFVTGLLTDAWWFADLGFSSVWRTRVLTTALSFVGASFVVVVLTAVVVRVLGRVAPSDPPDLTAAKVRALFGGRPTLIRWTVAAGLVLVLAPAFAANSTLLLLAIHGNGSDGPSDPLFGRPLGFYLFTLPILRALIGWLLSLFAVLVLTTLIGAHLTGSWRPGRSGGRLPHSVRVLVGALISCWFVVRGVGFVIDRWTLVSHGSGYVDGAGATDLRTRLPGLMVLAIVSMLVAIVVFVASVREEAIVANVAVGAWAVVALLLLQVVPPLYRQIEVRPNSPGIEARPIARNVAATRAAYGLDDVETSEFQPSATATASSSGLADELADNARIWGPSTRTVAAFNKVSSLDYLRVLDVDMDRYVIDGREQLVALGALDRVTLDRDTWSQKHLERTHGFGVVMAPAGEVVGEGEPRLVASGIRPSKIRATESRLYFGEDSSSYVIAGTDAERDVAKADRVGAVYTGNRGVAVGGFWKRAAFAARFGDRNLLLRSVPSSGRVLYVRNVRDRAAKVAPFLRFGADPYPVVLANRIVWVLDGYTVSGHYPYAQRFDTRLVLDPRSGLVGRGFNYVRASARIVIDAYDGSVAIYRTGPAGEDPLIDAWSRVYPGLIRPAVQLAKDRPGLPSHLRYPEDLLRLQSAALGRYHVTSGADFVDLANDWTPSLAAPSTSKLSDADREKAASATAAETTAAPRVDDRAAVDPDATSIVAAPLYLRHRYPGEARPSFVLQQTLELRRSTGQRRLLRAVIVADVATSGEGRLRVLRVPASAEALGPARAFDRMRANPQVSTIETQLGQVGSKVNFGDVQVLPTDRGLVYQRPLFLRPESSDLEELKYVLVLAGNRVTIAPTVREAFRAALASRGGATSTPQSSPTVSGSVDELLAAAAASLDAADEALAAGDLGTYQQRVNDAKRQIEAAQNAPAK